MTHASNWQLAFKLELLKTRAFTFEVQNVHPSRRLRQAFFLLLFCHPNNVNGKNLYFVITNNLLIIAFDVTRYTGIADILACISWNRLTINLGSQPEYRGQHLRPPNPNTSSSSSKKGRSFKLRRDLLDHHILK